MKYRLLTKALSGVTVLILACVFAWVGVQNAFAQGAAQAQTQTNQAAQANHAQVQFTPQIGTVRAVSPMNPYPSFAGDNHRTYQQGVRVWGSSQQYGGANQYYGPHNGYSVTYPNQVVHPPASTFWTTPGNYYSYPSGLGYYSAPVIVLPGFYFPGWTTTYYDSYTFPSMYGGYDGFPSYFYWPDPDAVTIYSGSPTLFQDGQFTDVGDPSMIAPVEEGASPIVIMPGGNVVFDYSQVPQGVRESMSDISRSWISQDDSLINRHIPQNGRIDVALNGRYAYSVAVPAYELMTHDAVSRIATSNFRFTGIRLKSDGNAIGYAEQNYRTSDGRIAKMYVAYALSKDPSQPSSNYKIVGIDSSSTPLLRNQSTSSAPVRIYTNNGPQTASDPIITYSNGR